MAASPMAWATLVAAEEVVWEGGMVAAPPVAWATVVAASPTAEEVWAARRFPLRRFPPRRFPPHHWVGARGMAEAAKAGGAWWHTATEEAKAANLPLRVASSAATRHPEAHKRSVHLRTRAQ